MVHDSDLEILLSVADVFRFKVYKAILILETASESLIVIGTYA